VTWLWLVDGASLYYFVTVELVFVMEDQVAANVELPFLLHSYLREQVAWLYD